MIAAVSWSESCRFGMQVFDFTELGFTNHSRSVSGTVRSVPPSKFGPKERPSTAIT
jgi:hypothetical protein